MTTIVARNNEDTIDIKGTIVNCDDGDLLIIADQKTIDDIGEWIGMHGVSGVYANPELDVEEVNDFLFISLESGATAIRFYKKIGPDKR